MGWDGSAFQLGFNDILWFNSNSGRDSHLFHSTGNDDTYLFGGSVVSSFD